MVRSVKKWSGVVVVERASGKGSCSHGLLVSICCIENVATQRGRFVLQRMCDLARMNHILYHGSITVIYIHIGTGHCTRTTIQHTPSLPHNCLVCGCNSHHVFLTKTRQPNGFMSNTNSYLFSGAFQEATVLLMGRSKD